MKLWSNNNVPRGNGGFNPERRLLAAVLQRAVTDYLTGDGELNDSAREWIYSSDDTNEAFGFAYICEALDFHKEELRKAIRNQYERQGCRPMPAGAAVEAANSQIANSPMVESSMALLA